MAQANLRRWMSQRRKRLAFACGIGKTLVPQPTRLKMPPQTAMTKPIGVDAAPLARHFTSRLLENAQCDGVQNYTARQPHGRAGTLVEDPVLHEHGAHARDERAH